MICNDPISLVICTKEAQAGVGETSFTGEVCTEASSLARGAFRPHPATACRAELRTEIHSDAGQKVQQMCLFGAKDVQFISLGKFRRLRSIVVNACC